MNRRKQRNEACFFPARQHDQRACIGETIIGASDPDRGGRAEGAQLLATTGWTKTWTTFSPFSIGVYGHVLGYKTSTGSAAVLKLNAAGDGITTVYSSGWTTGWA